MMKIAVVGIGYVGLCTGIGLALKGHEVTGITTTAAKSAAINSGKPPVHEEGLEGYLQRCIGSGSFRCTVDIESAVRGSDATFICVGTPSADDGSIDLTQVKNASASIGNALKAAEGYHAVVVKSTVVPGTTESAVLPLIEQYSGRHAGKEFGIAMNPEFLREGKAMSDFLNPDRIVVGAAEEKTKGILKEIYSGFSAPLLFTDIKTAEMIKYASNAFLTTKISFINELGNLCKKLGIDTYKVAEGMGLDRRISPHFLQAGIGYGGSCFPKDVKALIAKAKEESAEMKILEVVEDVNKKQRHLLIDMLKGKISLKGKTIAVLGLAFKPGTDDMRDSPAIDVINFLREEGALVQAYDPKAEENAKTILPDITYCASAEDALRNADACLILTDWPEFAELSDKSFSAMKNKIVIEGRRVLDVSKVSGFGGMCW